MSEWRAGFARPWIEWNGVEGEVGRVYVDGERVPTVDVWCDSGGGSEHDVWHDHCVPRGAVEPIGFSWAMPLENRLWAVALIDEHSSIITLDTDPRRVRCPINLSLLMDPPTAWLCPHNWDDDCRVDGHRSWDMGDAAGWVQFDSYETLMAQVRAWSGLTVSTDGPRVAGRRERLGRTRQGARQYRRPAGTVTRAEYDAGLRPAWWTEQ